MKHATLVVLLLSVAGLIAGVLVFRDGGSTGVAEAPEPLAADSPLPGNRGAVTKSQPSSTGDRGMVTPERSAMTPAHVTGIPMRSLSVHVSGLKNQSSMLHVAVFGSAEGFPNPEHSQANLRFPITSTTVDVDLTLPDRTTSAIAVFQDINGDGKLTKNALGLPMEPYGFSNNARSRFGPPPFNEAAFVPSEALSSLEITAR